MVRIRKNCVNSIRREGVRKPFKRVGKARSYGLRRGCRTPVSPVGEWADTFTDCGVRQPTVSSAHLQCSTTSVYWAEGGPRPERFFPPLPQGERGGRHTQPPEQ